MVDVSKDGRLKFYEGDHIYELDGVMVPSVTQILDPYSGLEFADPEALAIAQEFGTHVHDACHLWNIGELDYEALCEDEDNKALLSYLEGWIMFCEKTGFRASESELMVYHDKLKYAGKSDNLGRFSERGDDTLVDIKTGSSIPKTVGPQTAAYTEALGKRLKRLCVLLKPNNYSVKQLTDPNDFSIFKAALTLHRWLMK